MKVQYYTNPDTNTEDVKIIIHVTRLKSKEEVSNVDMSNATLIKRCVNPVTYQPEVIVQAGTDRITGDPMYYVVPLVLTAKDEVNE